MSSSLLVHEKIIEEDASIVEIKMWKVSVSEKYPDGVKYSLFWIKGRKILVGYDNHHPKGPHRHYGEKQEPYSFVNLEALIRDFESDRRRIYENQKNKD